MEDLHKERSDASSHHDGAVGGGSRLSEPVVQQVSEGERDRKTVTLSSWVRRWLIRLAGLCIRAATYKVQAKYRFRFPPAAFCSVVLGSISTNISSRLAARVPD